MKIKWKRLIWVVFICLYSALFFYNFHSPFKNFLIPYIYTIVLVLWLSFEYYQKHLFFQSGFLPLELFHFLLRTLFALFFYSALIIGNATVVWWPGYQTGLYPFIHIIGVLLLIISIVIRQKTYRMTVPDQQAIFRFYISVGLLVLSLGLGYGSVFVLVYSCVIGLPLLLLQKAYESAFLNRFLKANHPERTSAPKERTKVWQHYIDEQIKKRSKK